MTMMVFLFASLLIEVQRSVPVLQVHVNLKQGLSRGAFNSCISEIPAARIISPGSFDDYCRDIIKLVWDMGIDMMAISVVISNHFPAVIPAMIVKIRMPVTIG